MQFSTKIDGFEQKDSQGFENSYNSYEQYPLEKFFIFTIYQNYTLALSWAPKKGGFVSFLSKVCYCFVNKMSYKQPTCTNLGSNESRIIPLKELKKNIPIIYSSQELQLIKHN